MSKKGHWLNVTKVINPDIEKPCVKLRYCPYGQLVEEFPFSGGEGYTKLSCAIENGAITQFGHDCPVHYHMEYLCFDKDDKGVLCQGVLCP